MKSIYSSIVVLLIASTSFGAAPQQTPKEKQTKVGLYCGLLTKAADADGEGKVQQKSITIELNFDGDDLSETENLEKKFDIHSDDGRFVLKAQGVDESDAAALVLVDTKSGSSASQLLSNVLDLQLLKYFYARNPVSQDGEMETNIRLLDLFLGKSDIDWGSDGFAASTGSFICGVQSISVGG